ncbi:hypothetical protein JHK82_050562 [Glycine max]|nr:hypothetical protein JHK85_051273 [Glycine max]KAG5091784.1 hypothetical protein JHK82_050562 [Glycine max]KAG5094884.1 hypothetical protein JHK84_050472 [Glycine max]
MARSSFQHHCADHAFFLSLCSLETSRCGRWKNKQLEHLYDSLQQEFNVISKEKQKLKQEVQ